MFTHLGRAIAIVALVLGIIRITSGVMIAQELVGPYEAALARYTTAKSSGAMIDQGIYTILVAVAFGIMTEISYALRALVKTATPPKTFFVSQNPKVVSTLAP